MQVPNPTSIGNSIYLSCSLSKPWHPHPRNNDKIVGCFLITARGYLIMGEDDVLESYVYVLYVKHTENHSNVWNSILTFYYRQGSAVSGREQYVPKCLTIKRHNLTNLITHAWNCRPYPCFQCTKFVEDIALAKQMAKKHVALVEQTILEVLSCIGWPSLRPSQYKDSRL